jgi:peptidyl-dipeptidase Dcp
MSQNIEKNPLIAPTPYRNAVLPFDLVETSHFLPALDKAIEIAEGELLEIKNVKSPNFKNIIEALDNIGRKLDVVTGVFFHFDSAKNTEDLQEISLEFKTKLTKHENNIVLDEVLFKQIKAVYDSSEKQNLTDEQKLLLEDTYKSFVRNGALLDESKKNILRNINEKLSELQNNFSKNILSEMNDFELFIDSEAELSGLPEGAKIAAKESAIEAGRPDKWLFTLHAPSMIAVISYADNRALREKIWRAYSTRCKSGKYDNKNIILELVKMRSDRAKILGYATHADYVLEERMAKNKENVIKILDDYFNILKSLAVKEFDELKKFALTIGGPEDFNHWDIAYYSEKMKEKIYGFDSEQLRPYFQFEKVRSGAFEVASKLYNISFVQKYDYPLYNDDVETFDVIDNENGALVGVLYTDYFPRKTKQGGAWMSDYVKQSRDANGLRKPPVIGNHGNFTKPTKDKPSLLSLNEVLTLFHEFGHGLHGLLSDTKYHAHAGTNVKWDFVELPSQIMENWVKEKEVLNIFATHYETGKLMPDDLIEKMRAAENFRAASGFLRQVHFSKLDMMWHTANPEDIKDVESFEENISKDFYIIPPEGALVSTAFSHIFDGGYSAGYYSYKWAEILDADAFEAFKESGLFNPETAKKFRKLLSSGGSKDPEVLYAEFRGRKPDPKALLRRKGLA